MHIGLIHNIYLHCYYTIYVFIILHGIIMYVLPHDIVVVHKEPRMWDLRLLENATKEIKVTIIATVQADWEKLSDSLELPVETVRNLKAYPSFTPENACRSVFEKWLRGEGIKPKTWWTLIKVFWKMGNNTLVDNLIAVLRLSIQ